MTQIRADFDPVVTPQPAPAVHGEGPVMTDDAYQRRLDRLAKHPLLAEENIRLSPGATAGIANLSLMVGVAGLVLTLVLGIVFGAKHALAAYAVAVFTALAICLGSMFMVMIFHAMNAAWSVNIRRQFENIMSITWLPTLLVAPLLLIELLAGGILYTWLQDKYDGNFLLEHKEGFLNPLFFAVRYVVYGAAWVFLSRSLYSMSIEQDATGDRWLTRRMRVRSSWGLLVFALTTAFAAYDFLMSLDFRFFSTMWGVYYFAGAVMSGLATVAVVLAVLRRFGGKLNGVVTKEHFHDHGKLLFAFTVFWAYIAFSQYFLIWYSNIPEETAYYLQRKTDGWQILSAVLVIGHFILPFPILISRKTKKSTEGLALVALWLLAMQVLDLVWVVRPMVYVGEYAENNPGVIGWALDLAAVVGVLALFVSFLVRKIESAPLIPVKDPRLPASLKHKNYV